MGNAFLPTIRCIIGRQKSIAPLFGYRNHSSQCLIFSCRQNADNVNSRFTLDQQDNSGAYRWHL